MKKVMNLVIIFLVMSVSLTRAGGNQEIAGIEDDPDPVLNEFNLTQIPDLTDEQKEKIRVIHLNMAKEILPFRNELNENRARLHTLMTEEEPDMQSINSKVDEMADLRANIIKISLAGRQEVRKVLTEEQRILFDSRPYQRLGMQRSGRGIHRYPDRRGPYRGKGAQRFQRGTPSENE